MLGVITPELARDLDLGPSALGLLSGTFFVTFALAQLPVGVLLDRVGPRRTASGLMLLAAAGAVTFATAGGRSGALIGQALIGVGCAPVFMSALFVAARRYPPARFAAIASLILAVGQAGVIVGTTPLALVAEALGWRGALLIAAALMAGAALAVRLLVEDPPRLAASETLAAAVAGVLAVLRVRALHPILPMCLVSYGAVITIRGLWGGPYLADVFGLDPTARGNVLLVMSLGLIAGTVAYGGIERHLDRRREPVLVGTALTVAALATLVVLADRSIWVATGLLTLVGAASIHFAVVMAQARRFLADAQIGRGLTLLNGTSFAGAAILQILSGGIVAAAATPGAPAAAYRALFLFLALCLAAALAIYVLSTDRRG